MIKETVKIKIEDNFDNGEIVAYGNNVIFSYKDIVIEKKGDSPFVALKEIRQQLEKDNIYLIVNGSRKDVYPSGMTGNTFNAYVHRMGEPSFSKDIVNIFHYTDSLELICNVASQKEYFDQWVNSIKNLPAPR